MLTIDNFVGFQKNTTSRRSECFSWKINCILIIASLPHLYALEQEKTVTILISIIDKKICCQDQRDFIIDSQFGEEN